MTQTPHFEYGEALPKDRQKMNIKYCPEGIEANRLFNNHSRSETKD